MIFNTNSNDSQNSATTASNYYSESSHLYPYSDFKDAALIKNMFINADGHLCKRNSIKNVYSHSGTQIINSHYLTYTNGNKSQDLIYFIEDSDKKGSAEKAYINAISYDKNSDTYIKAVTNLTLPTPTKNYKFYSDENNIYAIGNDEIYGYSHLSETGFQSASPYVPLIQKNTNRLGKGIFYESRNLLRYPKVKVRFNVDGSTRDFKINASIASIDAVYLNNTLLDKSQYSTSIYARYASVTTTSVYTSDSDDLEIWYTLLENPYSDIRNPNGIVDLYFENTNIPCIYTNTHLYICGYSDCENTKYKIDPSYFPSNEYSKIDISALGTNVQNVVPLNNNRFAIITTNGNILIYRLSKFIKELSDTDKVIYILKTECIKIYFNPELSNSIYKPIGYNENNIYIGHKSFIICLTIDENDNIDVSKIHISSGIQSYLNENNITINDYKMHYCSNQDYIYLYNSQYDTIVYDIKNNCFYIYDGNYRIDSFVNDSVFIGKDKLTFKNIVNNKFGMDEDTYILGYYRSKPLSLCLSESTKILNKIILKTESFEADESTTNATINLTSETDLGEPITLSSDLISAKIDIPTTTVYESSEYNNFNDIVVKISLPSNIYKLDKIVFDRDILDDMIPSINT